MAEKVANWSEEEFMRFLEEWTTSSGAHKYTDMLASLGVQDKRSLVIDFNDVYTFNDELAVELLERMDKLLEKLSVIARDKTMSFDPVFWESRKKIHIRLRGLPVDIPLRIIGQEHVHKLIQVNGIVVRATSTTPIITEAMFRCTECNEYTLVKQSSYEFIPATKCEHCDNKKLRIDNEKSVFINYQRITIQERPEELPPGQMPRSLNIDLYDDLVDIVRPGDRVTVVGTPKLAQRRARFVNSRIFDIYLDGNNVESEREENNQKISEQEKRQLIDLSQDPLIFQRLRNSIAPSIYGVESIKEGILYLLFSGVRKKLPDVIIRGDINILLIGDPGTGKSQLLQFAVRMAPRGIMTTGRGSSAAGLTAAVVRDPSGNYILEAGALVLADLGVCCIDELDKMKEEDRGAIHPAMEQQIVTVAKGGIVASLNSRTSILASANPTLGRFNPYQTIAQNIDLPLTILSRFDLIFILRDEPDEKRDRDLAKHVLNLHAGEGSGGAGLIDLVTVRKYIAYAKTITPKMSKEASIAFENFYVSMRTSSVEGGEAAAISITARQLESLVRLAEARAKAHLREFVTAEDSEAVITLMQTSLTQVGIDATTGKIDIDLLYTGKPRSLQVQLQKILSIIAKLETQSAGKGVTEDDLLTMIEEKEKIMRPEATKLLGTLMRDGTIFSPRPRTYRRIHT